MTATWQSPVSLVSSQPEEEIPTAFGLGMTSVFGSLSVYQERSFFETPRNSLFVYNYTQSVDHMN